MAIIISVDHRCNNHCLFCSQADLPPVSPPSDVAARLEQAFANGFRRVDFVGGEPTLYDELTDWMATGRRIGFDRIGLQTNGRRLAYRAYTGMLAAAGLTHVDISLHGATAATHEFHTSVGGSFQQTLSGIRRARDAGLRTAVTTVLTRSNVHTVSALADVVAALGVGDWRVIVARAVGRAATDPRRMLPRWETAARHLADAHRVAAAHGCRMVVGGLPPCIQSDLVRWVDTDLPATFAEPCDRCERRAGCPGVDPVYLRLYGDRELRPLTGRTTAARQDLAASDTSAFVGGLGRSALW